MVFNKTYFEEIYVKYSKVLYFFAVRIIKDTDAAEDIVQDVYAECWIRREAIDISLPVKPYLYKLTYNRCLDFLKSSANKNILISDQPSVLDNILYSTFTQDDQMHLNEIKSEITQSINSLPSRCKEIFLLSRHKNLKNREIAEKLDISIKTVEKQISKALQEIRTNLLENGYLLYWPSTVLTVLISEIVSTLPF